MKRDQEKWRADRMAALSAEDGWLNLVARIVLPFGTHRVGSAPDCDIRLPSGPAMLGEIAHAEDGAVFTPIGGAPEPFAMASAGFPQVRVPPFLLELHDPGGQPALRVRDLTLSRTISLDYFSTDPDWVITAEWTALDVPVQTSIGQKGGSDTDVAVTHEARFRHGGEEYTIVPTHWKGGKPMFVFRDATSGTETYAASRFLFGEDASDGRIILDFNRAHNPPCAFTEFAICPLPPPGNVLPFPVRAGELLPQTTIRI